MTLAFKHGGVYHAKYIGAHDKGGTRSCTRAVALSGQTTVDPEVT